MDGANHGCEQQAPGKSRCDKKMLAIRFINGLRVVGEKPEHVNPPSVCIVYEGYRTSNNLKKICYLIYKLHII